MHDKQHLSCKAPITILLLTNGAWDNIGDHVIEACDIALIEAAAANLGLSESSFTIDSRDLSMVTNKYCKTEDQSLLAEAYDAISSCTLVLLGGAPVFNYAYQWFYKKTATILRIAQELNKPVFFSAIGIDSYSDTDVRSQTLKQALHNGVVKQITTRDGIDHLKRYARLDNADQYAFPISLVSDPAVFARSVFSDYVASKCDGGGDSSSRKTIGIFVFRAGGFADNGIPFSRAQQGELWRDVCQQLAERGYDYELLTSGHYADEAMLQYLIDEGYLDRSKCLLNINTPDDLVARISSYDGVITCRLHPSIISFSNDVPSVSLIWNSKVADFYKNVGYPERALPIDAVKSEADITGSAVVCALEQAMQEGIIKDQAFLESVYRTLVTGLAACLNLHIDESDIYAGQELMAHIPRYPGTSPAQEREKVARKFTRCYKSYNAAQIAIRDLKQDIRRDFHIIYHSGGYPVELETSFTETSLASAASNTSLDSAPLFSVEELSSGNMQVHPASPVLNNGTYALAGCMFTRENKRFIGWKVRFRIDDQWFWCLGHGGFISASNHEGSQSVSDQAKLFCPEETLPYLPVKKISVMVAEARWSCLAYKILYNSGKTSERCVASYDPAWGTVTTLASGSLEFSPQGLVANDGKSCLAKNHFSYAGLAFQGWRVRIKERNNWYWLLGDGSLVLKEEFELTHGIDDRQVFADGDPLPCFEARDIELAVAEAVWEAARSRKWRPSFLSSSRKE